MAEKEYYKFSKVAEQEPSDSLVSYAEDSLGF